jgi:2-hydroxychromene-2-carboxylate isomerase
MKTVDYYFTPVSPWTHFGHARLNEIARRHGATIAVKPVDFGRIFPVSGGLPLKQRAAQRQAYRMFELARWRDFLDIPIHLEPRFFPAPADPASLLILAAAPEGWQRQMDLAGALLRACWQEERNVADPATLQAVADGVGLPGETLLARAESVEIRTAYDALTDEAIARQVFGAPTYIIDDEPFWGQDRLDFVDRKLAGA